MKFEKRIAPLLKKREKNRAFYNKLIRAEQRKADNSEYDNLVSEFNHEDDMIQMEIDSFLTNSIINEAEALYLPIPSRSETKYWKDSQYATHGIYLSAQGISLLRDAIRDERKKRREIRFSYIEVTGKVVVMLTGLVGVCIGLVSILKK